MNGAIYSATTEGVKVLVQAEFQEMYSQPAQQHYLFTYRIKIENHSPATVQLLNRHWYIFDSLGMHSEVEGPGVLGVQPVLEPGQVHEYISGCPLRSNFGQMWGYYTMQRVFDGKLFTVEIPKFQMVTPYLMN